MAQSLRKIAILGPGGNVGKAIITNLLSPTHANKFSITAIVRPASTYTPPPNTSITVLEADLSEASTLTIVFLNQDCVINCLPGSATHYDPTKLIIDACVAASVRCYFANEFVGNILSSQFQALPEALVGGKIRVRRYLEQLAEEGRLDWMALNGGPFFEMWLLKGPAGIDVKGRRARIYGEGKKRLNWTPLKVIAEATVEMLAMYPDEQVVNRAMFIRGVKDSTQQRLLDAVEKVVGEKFDVKKVDVDKINRNAKIVFERGIKEQIGLAFKGLTISGQFFEEEGNDWGDLVTNEVVGVKEVDVEEAVRRVLEEFGTEGDVVEGMFRVEACEV